MIAAYLMRGKYAFMIKSGSTTSHYITYFFKMLDNLLSDWFGEEYKESTVFVFDNAKVHVSDEAKKFYRNFEIMVLNLPPYTPEYNKIELVFAQLKGIIKKKNLLNKQLEYIVAEAITELKS